jgi:hypothetical protein
MKQSLLITLLLLISTFIYSSPRISLEELLMQAEINPASRMAARNLAMQQGKAITILCKNTIMIDAKGIEDGRVVYSVFRSFTDIYYGGYAAYYEDAIKIVNMSEAKFDFGGGRITDNTGGYFDPVYTMPLGNERYLMIPEWTGDQVYLFNAANGDLVDASFIPTTNPQLQSPKHALQHPNGKQIVVSDQLSDVVQRFDSSGTYLGIHSPSTGVNTSILDNIRGAAFRPNNNILVCVGSGASQNMIQQFDSGGVHIAPFITTNLNSPFDILIRSGDILVSNSGGTADITRFSLTGTNLSFTQQMYRLPNGFILASSFSTPNSGLAILDSTGTYIRTLTAITGNRGVYLLGNGHYLVTNAAGVHEIDSSSGALIRTISTAANFQYVSYYNPDLLVSAGNNNGKVPTEFALYPNYPNPFNPVTNIGFRIADFGLVTIKIYDITGKEISILINEELNAGEYNSEWNASGYSSGIYFYEMKAGDFVKTMKMVLVK